MTLHPQKILVIDLAFIGDVLLATPVLRSLKEAFPRAEIVMLTVPLTAEIAAHNPYVARVIPYDKRGMQKGPWGMWQMSRQLRRERFELAICLNFAVRGAIIARLAGIPHRLGYDAQHAARFLTCASPSRRPCIQHETKNHLEVLRPLGIATADLSLALSFSAADVAAYREKLAALRLPTAGYCVLCPFGSYARKNLPTATAQAVAARLQAKSPVLLLGGAKEKDALESVARAANLPPSHVLAGSLSLIQAALLLKGAACLITVDTGPQHIAQAVGCPTLALFGPTDPRIWGPSNPNSRILYKKQDCSPCWGKGDCKTPCMEKFSAAEIIAAVEGMETSI